MLKDIVKDEGGEGTNRLAATECRHVKFVTGRGWEICWVSLPVVVENMRTTLSSY
jgi:hypothetical protein